MNPQQQTVTAEDRIEAALGEIRRSAKQLAASPRKLLDSLNQSMRRLRTFESEAQWSATIADACMPFAARVAVFSVNVNSLKLQASRGGAAGVPEKEVALGEARAFAQAIETAEPVVASRSTAEMSGQVARMFGENPAERFVVVPIIAGTKVVGTIYTESEDTTAIDLVATFAGAVLEAHRAADSPSRQSAGMIRIELNTAPDAPEESAPAYAAAQTEEHELTHLRARRFARTAVASILLDHAAELDAGRRNRNVYAALKRPIDQARTEYQRRFLNDAPIDADYLHSELIRTFGRNDEALLGPDYPGSMA